MIILTGGTGNLGGAIIAAATEALPAKDLRISTRNPDGVKAGNGAVEVRHGDFDDPQSLAHAFAGANQVVIVCANGSDEERVVRNRNAIDAAVAAGAEHVVFISYSPVAHAPEAIHADVAKKSEEHLQLTGVAYTILRCNYYAQLFLMFVQPALETGEILMPAGDGKAAMIGYGDIANCVIAALRPDFERGRVFELTGPVSVGYADLAKAFGESFGRTIEYRSVDGEEAEAWIGRLPVPPQYIPFIAMAAREVANGYFDHLTADVERLTGTRPQSAPEIWRAALSSN